MINPKLISTPKRQRPSLPRRRICQNPISQNPISQNPISQNPISQNPINCHPLANCLPLPRMLRRTLRPAAKAPQRIAGRSPRSFNRWRFSPRILAGPEDVNDDEFVGHAEPIEETVVEPETAPAETMQWFILKVQSNREKSICDALRRRVSVQGLDEFFGDILVPTEDVAEFKNGKRKVVKRKLYPGYIVANMVLNEETWFLVRETPGIGDFTGAAGKPTPMLAEEVSRIVKAANPEDEDTEQIKTAIPFKSSDRVRIKEGTFENFEGDVETIDEANGRVTVTINIFGRSTPVELEHWQIEAV